MMHKSILLKKKVLSKLTIVFVVIAVFAFLGSCTITETVIEEPSWKLVEELDGANKIILNGNVSEENKFFLSTLYKFWKINSGEDEPLKVYNNDYGFNPLSMNYKPVISDYISAYSNENLTAIIFKLNEDPNAKSYGYEYVYIHNIDSTLYDSAELAINSFRKPVGAFNNQNQFLTVIMNSGNSKNYGARFCLIDYEFDDSYSGIAITSTQVINFYSYHLPTTYIKSFGNRFFVGTYGITYPYLVYPTGDYHAMDVPSCLEFLNYQDTLYAFTTSYDLYFSNDLGENWELYAHFSGWVSFFEVAGKLCCHRDDDIHEINFDNGEVRELDNWGLEGNEITSINEFNDKVYITTLSGLFYRDVDEFFTYKEEDKGKGNLTFEKI